MTKATNTKDLSANLPGDTLSDLQAAFSFYDKENTGMISISHFKNILQNFGFHKLQGKDMIDELKKSDPNYNNRTFADLNFIMHVVAYRWFIGKNKETGMDEEAKEAFSLFDKNKRGYASQKEISNILSAHLGYELSP